MTFRTFTDLVLLFTFLEWQKGTSRDRSLLCRHIMSAVGSGFRQQVGVRVIAVALALSGVSACSKDHQAAAQKFLRSGEQYLASGKVNEAIIQFRNAQSEDPKSGQIRLKLADAYMAADDPVKALEQYVRAADLTPEETTAHLKAANLFLLAGRAEDAKQWAEKVLAHDPRNLPAQILLATTLAGLKDLDGAIAQIEEAIRLDPTRGPTYTNLGAFELGRGRKEAAEAAFKKAVELNAQSATAHLALANFYWIESRWSDAENELTRAIVLDPSSVIGHRALASFYIATGRASKAEPYLEKLRDLTKTPEATLALAEFYSTAGRESEAEALLNSVSEDVRTAARAQVRLAMSDFTRGRRTEAYDRLNKVLEKDSTNLNALVARTVLLAADRKLDAALESVALAVDKHEESALAFFWLGRVQAARGQTSAAIAAFDNALRLNPRATDARVALAQLHLAEGRPELSLSLAREVVGDQPENLSARIAIVRGLVAEKKLSQARAELDPLLARFPKSAVLHVEAGVLKGLQQDAAGARLSFERAIALEPDSAEALAGLVSLDIRANRMQDARARVEARIASNTTDPAVLMIAARTFAASGETQKAEALLRRIVQNEPGYFGAYSALGQLYVQQGRLDTALGEFQQIAAKSSTPSGALTFAGIILEAQGKPGDARAHYERAIQADQRAAVAANNLAWMFADSGENLDVALELAQRAAARMPESAEVNDTIGWVHYKNHRGSLAAPYFAKSIARDGTNAVYHYHLGLAYTQAGDEPRARLALERALTLDTTFAGADEARRLLAISRKREGQSEQR